MRITAQAIIHFAERHAERARELAAQETDPRRRAELERIAAVCAHVPAHAPRDFWEALQYYWFVHLGVTIELNPWDAFNPGHLDHHLEPFYQHGIAEGALTRDQAEELLQCLWIKFNNQPAPPKVGITAEESNTYTDFAQINTGGVRPDGSDAVNEVTYLMLDVIEDMRLLQPSSSIQVSKKNPNQFIKRAAYIIKSGFGQPSVFNHDVVVQEMLRVGKSIEDARNGGTSGDDVFSATGTLSALTEGGSLVVGGTTGESATLTRDEHAELIERAAELAAGRLPVIAGTGSNSTAQTIELSCAVGGADISAYLLVVPYYNKPTQEGLYRHYRAVAEAVDIDQILYNVPGRTAVDMQPETVARLAEIDNIIGVKEATGQVDRIVRLRALVPEGFAIYSGDDATAREAILRGADGDISVTANVARRVSRC